MRPAFPPRLHWIVALLAALGAALGLTARAQAAPPPAAGSCVRDGINVTCGLWARAGTLTLPDSTTVPIWGYADSEAGPVAIPGPTIVVNQNDVVTIVLTNTLAENTSLALHGQGLPADTGGAAPGGTATYTFTAARAGTFLYEAGLTANGARQVAMGLAGALVVNSAAAGTAYGTPATAFEAETVLILSEIDPALHAAPTTFDMANYAPRYWLINGQGYPATDPVPAVAGQRLLVRYLNAGLTENSLALLGLNQAVIAGDGYALPFSHMAVAETIPPGGTLDTIITIEAAAVPGTQYPLYSAAQHLDNAGAAYGGMLTMVTVTAPPGAQAPARPLAASFSPERQPLAWRSHFREQGRL